MSWKPTDSFAPVSRLRRTLAFRLTAAYALAGLSLVFLATASLYLLTVTEMERSTGLFIADKLNVLRTMLRERPNDQEALQEEIELESAARRYQQFYIRLLDERNQPLLMTPGMAERLDLEQLTRQTGSHPGRTIRMTGRHGRAFRVTSATAPVGSPSTQTDTIQIAIDVSQQEEFLQRYRLWFFGILLGTFVALPLIGYQIARRGIRPVEDMAATARRISSTNLRERILPDGYPFELASLAGTFNQMLDRLEDSFERISRFSADIAHDLRTPVNNIRGEAEVGLARARTITEYRDVLESCLEEAVRLSDLIGNLLFLARAESPLSAFAPRISRCGRVAGWHARVLRSFRGGGWCLPHHQCEPDAGNRRTGPHPGAARSEQSGLERRRAHSTGRIGGVGCQLGSVRCSHRSSRHRRWHSSRGASQSV